MPGSSGCPWFKIIASARPPSVRLSPKVRRDLKREAFQTLRSPPSSHRGTTSAAESCAARTMLSRYMSRQGGKERVWIGLSAGLCEILGPSYSYGLSPEIFQTLRCCGSSVKWSLIYSEKHHQTLKKCTHQPCDDEWEIYCDELYQRQVPSCARSLGMVDILAARLLARGPKGWIARLGVREWMLLASAYTRVDLLIVATFWRIGRTESPD